MIKGIIFDMDGTLIDSMKVWSDVDKKFLKSFGIDPPADISDIVKKMTIKESSEYFIKRFGLKLSWEEVSQKVSDLVKKEYYENIPLKSGASELLDFLDEKSIPYGVATATYPDMAEKCLKRLKIYDRMRFVLTQNEVPAGKTEPDIYFQGKRLLGLENNYDVMVVEDSLHCIETASKAGFFTAAVEDDSAFADKESIIAKSHIYFKNILEIKKLFEERASIEKVGGKSLIFKTKVHAFGTDAILLSDFANIHKKDRVLDIGTGCGIIPVLLYKNKQPAFCDGCDIDPDAVKQAEISAKLSKISNKTNFFCTDIRVFSQNLKGCYEYVISNPPYFEKNSGIISPVAKRAQARHDISLSPRELCSSVSDILLTGKKFAMCSKPERLAEVIHALKHYNLEPKRLRFVQKDINTKPWLFLIEAAKDANVGLEVMTPLLMYDTDGNETQELKKIYNMQEQNNNSEEGRKI